MGSHSGIGGSASAYENYVKITSPTLMKMLPTQSENYSSSRCRIDSISTGNLSEGYLVSFVKEPNISDIRFCKFCHSVSRTFKLPATFVRTISNILFICSKPKMCGIYARRIIARMADTHTIRNNFYHCDDPRQAMKPTSRMGE